MRALIWTAYLVMACEGFLLYDVGFITPYLRHDLGVDPWLAAFPTSAMAIGTGIGGILARRLNRRFGSTRAIRASIGAMALGAVLLATAVHILVVILGALLLGAAIGGLLVHVNSALGHGPRGGTMLSRANLSAVLGGVVGPLVVSAAAGSIGWWVGSLVPVPFLLVLALITPGSPAHDERTGAETSAKPLPREYWLTWAYLVLCIGIEFSYVTWGSQVVAARTGLSTDASTGLASVYVLGMVAGRVLASLRPVARRRQLQVLRLGTAATAVGALITWLAPIPAGAAVGLFLGGLGMAPIYPFGASIALAKAPGSPLRAASVLTVASSLAIFSAPLVLGVVVGFSNVLTAWAIVLALVIMAFVLVLRIGVPAGELLSGDLAEVLPG